MAVKPVTGLVPENKTIESVINLFVFIYKRKPSVNGGLSFYTRHLDFLYSTKAQAPIFDLCILKSFTGYF